MKSSWISFWEHILFTEVLYDCCNFNFVHFLSLTLRCPVCSFEILFFLSKMLNKIKLSTDFGFIPIYSFKVYRGENLIVPRFHFAPIPGLTLLLLLLLMLSTKREKEFHFQVISMGRLIIKFTAFRTKADDPHTERAYRSTRLMTNTLVSLLPFPRLHCLHRPVCPNIWG